MSPKNTTLSKALTPFLVSILLSSCGSDQDPSTDTQTHIPANSQLAVVTSSINSFSVDISAPGDNYPLDLFPAKITLFDWSGKATSTSLIHDELMLTPLYPDDLVAIMVGNTIIMEPQSFGVFYFDGLGDPIFDSELFIEDKGDFECIGDNLKTVEMDFSNLPDNTRYTHLRNDVASFAEINSSEFDHAIELCAYSLPTFWMDHHLGVYSAIAHEEVRASLEDRSLPLTIPTPTDMPISAFNIDSVTEEHRLSVKLSSTNWTKKGYTQASDIVNRHGPGNTLNVPYLPGEFSDQSYYFEAVSRSSVVNPFTGSAITMEGIFGHLNTKIERHVGHLTEAQLLSGVHLPALNFPFDSTTQGHGSALLSGGHLGVEEMDLMIMEFKVKDSIHATGQNTEDTVRIITNIAGGIPQIQVLMLSNILDNIGTDVTATSIVVRDYENGTEYVDALNHWMQDNAPYTEVGLTLSPE